MHWEVNLTVDGKRLSDVLEAIEGKAIEWSMRAIRGAVTKENKWTSALKTKRIADTGKLTEIPPAGGSVIDKVADWLRNSGAKEITPKELKEIVAACGGAPAGVSYYVLGLRKRKILGKGTGKGSRSSSYQIL